MIAQQLTADVFELVRAKKGIGVGCETGVDGFFAFANDQTTACSASFYDPVMCLVLQGTKEARIGGRVVRYGAGDTLIVSHAVPVEAAVIEACPDHPYAAVILRLDLVTLRSLQEELGPDAEEPDAPLSLNAAASDAALIDAVSRLFYLRQDPVAAKTLAPLIMREIHFRLLRARHGGMLRQLLRQDSPASRISKAIAILRRDFTHPIAIADLAEASGMSLSAFHEHFKTVTATTPLQYQKDLRLLEARQRLVTGAASVATTAYDVGYESPTQFSREYARKFGLPPSAERNRALEAAG